MGCYWVEEYTTLQLHRCSCAEVNKFLLAYVIMLKHVYFRQYYISPACAKEYLTAANVLLYYRIAVVISEIIVCSGRHFLASFLW